MIGALIASLVVFGVVVALVYPLFRPPLETVGDPPGPAARLAALEDRKAAIYGSIRDLGHDLRTDKLTDDDYRREAETLKQQAVGVLAEIEQLRHELPRASPDVETRIAAIRAGLGGAGAADRESDARVGASQDGEPGAFCTSCGQRAREGDRFCAGCGAALRGGE